MIDAGLVEIAGIYSGYVRNPPSIDTLCKLDKSDMGLLRFAAVSASRRSVCGDCGCSGGCGGRSCSGGSGGRSCSGGSGGRGVPGCLVAVVMRDEVVVEVVVEVRLYITEQKSVVQIRPPMVDRSKIIFIF